MLGVMGLFLLMNTTHVTSSCKGTSTNCGLNKLYIDTHKVQWKPSGPVVGPHFACVPQNRACVLMHNHYGISVRTGFAHE